MFVVVFNEALCRYISQVLPSLGIEGVAIRTYGEFTSKLRISHFEGLSTSYCPDTPSSVTKLKKHPVMLRLIDDYISELAADFESKLELVLERNGTADGNALLRKAWEGNAQRPLRHRIHQVRSAASKNAESLSLDARVALDRLVTHGLRKARDVATAWADILSDFPRLRRLLDRYAPEAFSQAELVRAYEWCSVRCGRILSEVETERDEATAEPQGLYRVTPDSDDESVDDDAIEASASTEDNLKRRQP